MPVNVIHLDRRPTSDAQTTRDAFGQAAYCGLLPRDQWLAAQELVNRFDDAGDADDRAAIADLMTAMTSGPARAAA